jgi:hypothetical protein
MGGNEGRKVANEKWTRADGNQASKVRSEEIMERRGELEGAIGDHKRARTARTKNEREIARLFCIKALV